MTMKGHHPDCPLSLPRCKCTCGFEQSMDNEIVRLTNAYLAWLGRHSGHTLAVSEADGVFALMAVNEQGQRVGETGERILVAETPIVVMATIDTAPPAAEPPPESSPQPEEPKL